MATRLLTKNEIAKAKSDEQSKTIQEGLKITKRIDSLREIQANEQASLDKFRKETVRQIKEEVGTLEEQKASLLKEVGVLIEKRRLLLIPLDREWGLVREQEEAVGKIRIVLEEKTLELQNKEEDIRKRKKLLADEENRIKDEKARAQDNLVKSSENLLRSRSARDEAEAKLLRATEFYDAKFSDIFLKETEMLAKERDLANKESSLKRREKELNIFNEQLNDKYQTLLDSEKRNGRRK